MTTALSPDVAMGVAHERHGAGRRAGDEAAVEIARRDLAGIDDMQAVDVLFRLDRLDDRIRIQVLGQRQLDEDTIDGLVGTQRLDERGKLFLCGLFRQRMLDGLETALLRHAAFRADIGVACRIIADDDDSETGLDAGLVFQGHGRGLHGVNHGSGNLLPIDNGHHRSPHALGGVGIRT